MLAECNFWEVNFLFFLCVCGFFRLFWGFFVVVIFFCF